MEEVAQIHQVQETLGNTSKNANLKELHLDVEGLSPKFNKNTTNYNITVRK